MSKRIKTATITFQDANNYGAILQTYALQRAIKKAGCENEVINYQCTYMKSPYGLRALKNKGLTRYILGNIYAIARIPRIKEFSKLRKKILMTSKIYSGELSTIENKYDFFICGSDQIWNGSITNLDPAYFLNFVKNPEKKKSYAASFGFEQVPNDMIEKYRSLLANFSSINMREESGVKIINSLLGKSSETVLDPTMLLNLEEWNSIAEEKKQNNKYILIYQVGMSSFLLKKAKEIASLTGLKIRTVPFPIGGIIKTGINLFTGPQRWIGLIKNAELVITDSFHGSAFSIMYNKRFFVCLSEGSTRINNLLNMFDLNNALLLPGERLSIDYEIDWSKVNSILSIERQRSKDILSNMLHVK